MRALIVTNMWPSPAAPALGTFVRDQVAALQALPGVDVEVFAFPPKGYVRAARELRRRYAAERFDVVHAHFGLTAWPALAVRHATRVVTLHGTDLRHPRSRRITRPRWAVTTSSPPSAPSSRARSPAPAGAGGSPSCRAASTSTASSRSRAPRPASGSGSTPTGRYLLFPADPARPAKRPDRARELADATGRSCSPSAGSSRSRSPYWVNAANAVVVPSDHEGFGLAVLEALACDVPVLATRVGNHAVALDGVDGALCAPYDMDAWSGVLRGHLDTAEPRVEGRARAALWSAERMAKRVLDAWIEVSGAPLYSRTEAPSNGAVSI